MRGIVVRDMEEEGLQGMRRIWRWVRGSMVYGV